ncbi:MAG TPA: DUF4125 family protein [Desulfovibrio sp.]|uniref:DUF4125 family protein n=1 Tax=Desulfovibrio sp. TaxID=885 RepID=UPI002D63EE3A|nr:DUF4125 family protein [Desulfovibrio sp.]HZF62277.1 DUF4125 family protein [Desulfovibrio sp.]
MTNSNDASVINEIIALELKMFQTVTNEGGKADCQNQPEAFRTMRQIVYEVLSPQVLAAWLSDLRDAERAGRNVMTEKYALMCGSIEMPEISQTIKNIISCELAWLQTAVEEHPDYFDGTDEDFCRYLLCELLMYSETTLHAYAQCITDAQAAGRNLVMERLENVKKLLCSTAAHAHQYTDAD